MVTSDLEWERATCVSMVMWQLSMSGRCQYDEMVMYGEDGDVVTCNE